MAKATDGRGQEVPGTDLVFAQGKTGTTVMCRDCRVDNTSTVHVRISTGAVVMACYLCFWKTLPAKIPDAKHKRVGSWYTCTHENCIADGDFKCAACGQQYCALHMAIRGPHGACVNCMTEKINDAESQTGRSVPRL